jgi:ATP-binding cassette subfamily B protein
LLVFITAISEVILFYRGGQRVAAGSLSLGQFVALFDYLAIITWPVMASGFVTNLFVRGKVSVKRINEVVDSQHELEEGAFRPAAPRREDGSLLRFDQVTFGYGGSATAVVQQLDLELQPGQWLGVAGPTGSGKSSLLRLVARLYDPQQGHIYFEGRDIRDWDLKELRAALGMVTQEPFLFSETIRENIQFGAPGLTLDEVHRYAAAADMDGSIAGFERGMETMLGEKGVNLSGGQKQRMALARAMAMRPRLLLLDDSFSAVDTRTEEKIVSGLRRELPGTAVLLVSHRISTLALCDQIVVMQGGRKVAQGSHAALLEKEGFYSAMSRREQRARQAGLGLEES